MFALFLLLCSLCFRLITFANFEKTRWKKLIIIFYRTCKCIFVDKILKNTGFCCSGFFFHFHLREGVGVCDAFASFYFTIIRCRTERPFKEEVREAISINSFRKNLETKVKVHLHFFLLASDILI